MKKHLLAVVTAVSFAANISSYASATPVAVPHPAPPVHHYHHHAAGGHAALKAGICVLGGIMAWQSPEKSRLKNEVLWDVGCAAGSFVNPAGGILGGVTLLTFFSDQGIFTKTFRPGGWRCQPEDVGLVTGCKEYLEQVASESRHRH